MYQDHFHPDSEARDLPNWVSNALDDIARATEADFRAGAPVDEDEDAAAPGLLTALGVDVEEMDADLADLLISAAHGRWCDLMRVAA